MSPTADEHNTLLLTVAQQYYEQDRTQDDIGRELYLTRWKIGRLLEEARRKGIVRIQVVHAQARQTDMERELRRRFGLSECIVVPAPTIEDHPNSHVAKAAADFLQARGSRIQILGVSWGNTLQDVAAALPEGWNKGVEVIQINGSVSRSIKPTMAASVATSIAHSGQGYVTLLPVPSIVEHIATKRALDGEQFVTDVLDKGRKADVLLFSLGALDSQSVLVQSGAINNDELRRLKSAKVCGDVLAHYITPDGAIADADLESRTMGLTLDDLRKAKCAVAVASGERKTDVISGALTSGLCSVLITDDTAARHILEN